MLVQQARFLKVFTATRADCREHRVASRVERAFFARFLPLINSSSVLVVMVL